MKTYTEVADECGPLAHPKDWYWCLVRQGEDIIAQYERSETARWNPNGDLIVTVPDCERRYFKRAVWSRRLFEYTGCSAVGRRRNAVDGTSFTFEFRGNLYRTKRALSISADEQVTILDPCDDRTINRRQAKQVRLQAHRILHAAIAAASLGPPLKYDWRMSQKYWNFESLASLIFNQEVGELSEVLTAGNGYGQTPSLEVIPSIIHRCRPELYELAGAFKL